MKFIPSSYCEDAAAALSGLISPEMLPLFLQWINDGSAILWKVVSGEDGDNSVTWLITRVESFPNGNMELVLDVIAGVRCREIVNVLMKRARASGMTAVRFETHHGEKLAKKFIGGLGFERVATVFKAVL